MPHSPATSLDRQARCELKAIAKVWRQHHPHATAQAALLEAVEETGAPSFQEAVDTMYRDLVKSGIVKPPACARR